MPGDPYFETSAVAARIDRIVDGSDTGNNAPALRIAIRELVRDVTRASEPQPMCKGDWMIGSACGTCSRCIETAKPLIEHLKQNIGQCEAELGVIWACVPLPEGERDVSDAFKVHCFNEIRRLRSEPRS